MTAIAQRLSMLICALALMVCCKQKPAGKTSTPSNSNEIQQLIKTGERLENAHADSLPAVAARLLEIGQAGGSKKAIVYSRIFTAHYLWMSSRHEESMTAAVKCLADIEKYDINEAYPEIYGLIANLHKESTNFKMAFQAQEKGLKWAIANKDTAAIIGNLSMKAMFIHSYRKGHGVDNTLPDSSINVQIRALKVAESSPKYELLRIPLYDNVGQYYLDNKDYKRAIVYAAKGVELAEKYDRKRSLTYGYCWLGQALFFTGGRQEGMEYLNKALDITRAIKEPYREMEIYEHMYDCYLYAGDYKTALGLLSKAKQMRDSVRVKVNEVKLSELQIKYETAKKDKEIAEMDQRQTRRNRQLIVTVAGCLLFIVFSIILFLQYRIIRKDNQLRIISSLRKDKALENIAFIQSHELRKPLASILGLITVIKLSEQHVDPEALDKLEKAGEDLDTAIRSIIVHVEEEAKG
ncbi:tetratricopeptide repeat protein [Mucilaginibacter psychrotolerans]|uniref:histidine kinase n=1 Tax=Mucilaginibacter psychrotolerans TaxID=1524096 RepID=A0A4Y8SAG6_9SPHI|nr:HAMP domain-containing histidine kinase [Mucilaginibacter psychrotolerans]TFF35635.1 HAMP domain-containing histidine kinase [Mucilaginibacter psychrotolerans]